MERLGNIKKAKCWSNYLNKIATKIIEKASIISKKAIIEIDSWERISLNVKTMYFVRLFSKEKQGITERGQANPGIDFGKATTKNNWTNGKKLTATGGRLSWVQR